LRYSRFNVSKTDACILFLFVFCGLAKARFTAPLPRLSIFEGNPPPEGGGDGRHANSADGLFSFPAASAPGARHELDYRTVPAHNHTPPALIPIYKKRLMPVIAEQ
jgi:hypothetical protein